MKNSTKDTYRAIWAHESLVVAGVFGVGFERVTGGWAGVGVVVASAGTVGAGGAAEPLTVG